ncbi:MAG: PHP domain-containing protein, partial [Clostridia bacterium]|nr:PHP domain-containing protein [Clostridia bacterium]
MKKILLPETASYKANLHCHTVLSDGHLTPEEVKAAYQANGYSVVAFTDHEALLGHDDLTDDGFIALNGYETAVKPSQTVTNSYMPVHHINFIKKKPRDLTQFCFYPENFTPGACKEQIPFIRYTGPVTKYEYSASFMNELIATARANGCLVFYNHPRWSLQTVDAVLELKGLTGLEILNTTARYNGDFDASFMSDLARRGMFLPPVGGDDNHNRQGVGGPFGGFTQIFASSFTYEAITDALEKGDVVASSGPLFRGMTVEDGVLTVKTSPVSRITLITEGRYVKTVRGEGGYVDSASFLLPAERVGNCFRVEAEDRDGNKAYTRY